MLTHNGIGDALSRTGKPADALKEYGKALDMYQKLADDNSSLLSYRNELARSHNNIGRVHARQGRFPAAVVALEAGLAIRRKLPEANPDDTDFASGLGDSLGSLGWAEVRAGRPAEAAADLRRAVELWARDPAPYINERFEHLRALALLAGLGADAKSGVTATEAAAFADRAIAVLKDAVGAGWARRDELDGPDFAALRPREDFQTLLTELDAKAPERLPPPRVK